MPPDRRDVKFSVGLWGMQAFKHNPRHHVALYEEMVEDALVAEELGFDNFWLTEHHFWYDGYCPSLLVAAAAVAARTSRIRVGTSMLLLPLHDPLRVAEGTAVCDIISGGRFDLGVAVGYREPEFQGFGRRVGERGRRMDEALDVLQLAWTKDHFSYEGRYYRYQDVSVTPRPIQRPVPIWIGGWAPPVVERAARRGYNLMGAGGAALEQYAKVAAKAGIDISRTQITTGGDVWVDDDEESARSEILPLLHYLYHEQLGGWKFLRDAEGQGIGFDRPQMLEGMVNAVIGGAMLGKPETVAAAIEARLAANPTANHVFCRVRFDSVPRDRLHRCMELLAKEVMPRVRSAKAPA